MPRRVRLLHVVRTLAVGGLEVALVDLIRGLQQEGFDQGVCCIEQRGELADRLPREVPVWACAEGRRSRWQRPEIRAVSVVREFRPDVTHAENYGAWIDGGMAWLAAGRPGRLAFTMHGWNIVDRMPRRQAFVCRQLARITAAVTCVSPETAREFADETGIPARRVGVLSLGVDTDRFQPPPSGGRAETRPVVFGCAARLNPIKGHDVLLAAAAELRRRGRTGFQVRLIGDGPVRPSLEALAASFGLGDTVGFLGTRHDLPEQLQDLDVFVLPSHREGRPLSIMEALAAGLPVVATAVGSVPGLVRDGETGLLVEPGDPAALADAMETMLLDASFRQRAAAAARIAAVSEFSLRRMVHEYARFYRGVFAGQFHSCGFGIDENSSESEFGDQSRCVASQAS